jgi:hypothetical protein
MPPPFGALYPPERAIMVVIRVLQERGALCGGIGADAESAGRRQGVAYWLA